MAFTLDGVVPWGRSLAEYRAMFCLTEADKGLRIAGFGDGPASFNCEATRAGYCVTSFDPIYRFTRIEPEQRISEVRAIVLRQMAANKENYLWTSIRSLEEPESVRMSAMRLFLADYETGLREGRYIPHELPERLPYPDDTFDLGLSSHFLLMYTGLGYDFHIAAIDELLRVCREVRIYPVADPDTRPSELIDDVIEHYRKRYPVELRRTGYEFRRGASRVLIISKAAR